MAPKSTTALKFQSIIRTRNKNKNVHPGEPDQVAKRRSQAEMEEIRAQKAAENAKEEKRLQSAIAKAASIEDDLREDEEACEKAAKGPKPSVAAFRPRINPPSPDPLPVVTRSSSEVEG